MTALNKQALREKFEAWAEEAGALPWGHLKKQRTASGNYSVQIYTYMWHAWNSCHEALLDELEIKEEQRTNWFQMAQKLGEDLDVAEKRIAELEAGKLTTASRDVLAERQRQISMEGWKPEHDDEHCNGELAMAAVCYINETGTVNRNGGKPWGWPWDASWWKPNSRRRNLVKAGALIIAEIERIDRAAGIGVKGE